MIAEYRKKSNVGVSLWLVLRFVLITYALTRQKETTANVVVFWLLFLTGSGFLLWGCWAQARGKGYPGATGLLGLLGFIGLIILAILPDKEKQGIARVGIGPVMGPPPIRK